MAANTAPIYSKLGSIGLNGANTVGTAVISDYAGTGANNKIVYTGDATNGNYVQRLRFKALGTNAVSVARIFINNGTGTEGSLTAANCSFYGEVSLPATTATTTTATTEVDYPLNFALPPGYRIVVGISAAANLASGWAVTTIAGVY